MPKLRWQALQDTDSEKLYLAMASYLPLSRFRDTFRFLGYTRAIKSQLSKTKGVLGYALLARPLSGRYWTLSLWEDQEALMDFVREAPHGETMKAMRPRLGQTKFVQWEVSGSDMLLSWETVFKRLEGA